MKLFEFQRFQNISHDQRMVKQGKVRVKAAY